MSDFRVPFGPSETEFTEKRSRFIGHLLPAETEEQAREFIAQMKKKYYDARHNCWCYLIGGDTIRYGDDGEPQGTAGQPMLNVFQRENVTNVVCVVTRYFGGILLGAGGLTRAYSKSARDALVAAINLNIFNNHCDTVCMANIAQMVNDLQAMILTEGSKMVLTPTYHVFALYAAHQGAQQLESYAETSILRHDEEAVPTLHVSASRAADGKILVTVANLDASHPAEAQVLLGGVKAAAVNGTVLCGTADARNTFTAPDAV